MRRFVIVMVITVYSFLGGEFFVVAEVFYQWQDKRGVVHLTDDLTKVPEEYRENVQEIDLSEEIGRQEEGLSHPRAEKERTITPHKKVDFQGHDRAWWQGRLREWRAKKAKAEEQLVDAKRRLGQNRMSSPTIGRRQKDTEIREEIRTYEGQVQQAERMLKDQLLEEARKAGAPPGWLRE